MTSPMARGSRNYAQSFGRDFLASIVVFLVALPLCLGIALASGVPPALGLIAGMIGGIVIGLFTGAPLQVSGPAAGLVSLVWEVVQTHGLESLGVVVLLAGLIQISIGLFRLAPFFRAVSPALVQGMLAGIGVIIFASQFHAMVDDKPTSSAVMNLVNIPAAIYKGLVPLDGASHHLAAVIGVLTIGILIFWAMLPKKFHIVPAALVAVVIAVLVSIGLDLPIKYVEIPEQFLDVVQMPHAGSWSLLLDSSVWISALTIAFVATAETLLSTTALDQLHTGPRANYDKEVIAQGIGNMVSGFLGALPITGVIIRSSANIEAKAQTRLSTILHGVWIGALVLFCPFVLELIPLASLAAILVYTGYKLIRVDAIKKLFVVDKSEVVIYFVTLFAVVGTNLLEGVMIGFTLAMLKLLYTLAKLKTSLQTDPDDGRIHLFLSGSATFMSLPKLAHSLEQLPAGQEVHIHIDGLSYIDHACLQLIINWEKLYQKTGGQPVIQWDELTRKMNTKHNQESQSNSLVESAK